MTAITRRAPSVVMRLDRLGAMHQSRLSFMRILTRRMKSENWQFGRPVFDIDATGVGRAVYTAKTPDRTYSLVAFAHDLPPEKRTDRVIAEAWDATFALFDGVPDEADLTRLAANVPLQEAGRISERELSLSRANRSVRLWEHVVARLANGQQPDPDQIAEVGYLMRTTAVYGSGKFGAADREMIADRPEMHAPFQVEMLSVYLTRAFVRDLVQHLARARGGDRAAQLAPDTARRLGIGNSTGLGLAPYIINHPQLFNNWIAAREEALARVRNLNDADPRRVSLFRSLLARAILSVAQWRSQHPLQITKLAVLRTDMDRLAAFVSTFDFGAATPWDSLFVWAEDTLGTDAQEALASLMLEPHGDLVDDLARQMADTLGWQPVNGNMTVARLQDILTEHYAWAIAIDWTNPAADARAWYVSAEKLEPRLGERHAEPIADYELPLSPGREVARLAAALAVCDKDMTVAEFLRTTPGHRWAVRRAQLTARAPYAEIHDNTIDATMLPIDMLRCKLAFFGAQHFDPRSDRWVRISMYGGAPYPEELAASDADYWVYPDSGEVAQ